MLMSNFAFTVLAIAQVVSAYPDPISSDKVVFRQDSSGKLPQDADARSLKFQPWLDFDKDSCYNTAAIDLKGNLNRGLPTKSGKPSAGCRDPLRLFNANVYVRSRCNNGWCAYMYEYYFEVDRTGNGKGGHRHAWENVIVFIRDDTIFRVAPSAHGNYYNATNRPMLSGTHPLIVYHKDGDGEHAFRFAKMNEVKKVENWFNRWHVADLVDYNGYPSQYVGRRLKAARFGRTTHRMIDPIFGDTLKRAMDDVIPNFDPHQDANCADAGG
ncbi:hypothetical protein FHETE_7860 [Fusarium heterosporum]|uniref:Uncharacterized protein n=1 Tax=Fusarium heterosporum TaxID=42747 RepID=A0A8H5SZC2_FUSHE|nr:hypothetical protein FHETE_7860 [Fusarium heterosporum]